VAENWKFHSHQQFGFSLCLLYVLRASVVKKRTLPTTEAQRTPKEAQRSKTKWSICQNFTRLSCLFARKAERHCGDICRHGPP